MSPDHFSAFLNLPRLCNYASERHCPCRAACLEKEGKIVGAARAMSLARSRASQISRSLSPCCVAVLKLFCKAGDAARRERPRNLAQFVKNSAIFVTSNAFLFEPVDFFREEIRFAIKNGQR
jgi:hypothetical protein